MAEGKLLPYLDVPFQHASRRILKLMKRPADSENNLARIERWREICPDITLRSTFIVGFPGETEGEFQRTAGFPRGGAARSRGLLRLLAAWTAPRRTHCRIPVPEEVKAERRARFMAGAGAISAQRLARRVGQHAWTC